ncbi:G-protein coupled receptor 161-like [Physella acuta]|uniref:G-protein coupled receptor 161-like n=1 Tax=Physella acuta TaxID=109671 RepID=UPI0027DE8B5D|nr:G-protein coupled receptor 161-like [Physella acuta]
MVSLTDDMVSLTDALQEHVRLVIIGSVNDTAAPPPPNDVTPANSTQISTTETTIMGTLLASVFLASLLANAFVFVVFCKRKSISMSNRFVANLTIGNCLSTVCIMPFAFTSLVLKDWVFGAFWCQATGFMMNVIVSASIFTLVVISVDRYCAVVTPLHYSMRLTSRRCTLLIVCIWAGAVLISAPPLMGWNAIEYQLDKMVCTVTWYSSTRFDRYYTCFLISCSFVLPLGAIFWTYAKMFRAAHGNIVRARRNSVVRVNSASTNQSDDTQQQNTPINSRRRSSSAPIIRRLSQSSSRSSSLLWRKEEWKTAVTSFLVLFSFALCWAPYFVVMAVEAGLGRASPLLPITSHVSTVLAMFSCACNPLVYVFRSKLTRRELTSIVRGRANSDHEICVPHEFPRRLSGARNESGRSLRSMGEVEEEKLPDLRQDDLRQDDLPRKKSSSSKIVTYGGLDPATDNTAVCCSCVKE